MEFTLLFIVRFDAWTVPVPEGEVTWAKNWLVQHVKNTDFKYIGLLPHHVPNPYEWNDGTEVFYGRLDDEHKGLFDHIRMLGHNPTSTSDLAMLKSKMRAHFDYERGSFCNAETYNDCDGHTVYLQNCDLQNPEFAKMKEHFFTLAMLQKLQKLGVKYREIYHGI